MVRKRVLLSTKEVAERLGFSKTYVRYLIKEGIIKAQKIGHDYIIDESKLKPIKRKRRLRHEL